MKEDKREITIADIISFKGEYLGLNIPAGLRCDINQKIGDPQVVIYEKDPEEGRGSLDSSSIILISKEVSRESIDRILHKANEEPRPAAVIIEIGKLSPATHLNLDNTSKIPIFFTSLEIPIFYKRLMESIEVLKRPYVNIHGVLMDIYGLGVILRGKSGIGKSECALELITRGHRLVCDDMIILTRRTDNALIGYGSDVIKYHMEIRGLGIINVKDLFGISTIRDSKKVELIIEMVEWENDREYDRLGVNDSVINILGISVPYIILPVRSNRNIATIVEVAARNQLLKLKGFHSARSFQKNIVEIISRMGNIEQIKEEKD